MSERGKPSRNILEYYNDEAGDFRWRVTNSGNHKIVAASTEGFKDLRHAMDNYSDSTQAVATEDVILQGDKKKKKGNNEHGIATDDGSAGEHQEVVLDGHDGSDQEEDPDSAEG